MKRRVFFLFMVLACHLVRCFALDDIQVISIAERGTNTVYHLNGVEMELERITRILPKYLAVYKATGGKPGSASVDVHADSTTTIADLLRIRSVLVVSGITNINYQVPGFDMSLVPKKIITRPSMVPRIVIEKERANKASEDIDAGASNPQR